MAFYLLDKNRVVRSIACSLEIEAQMEFLEQSTRLGRERIEGLSNAIMAQLWASAKTKGWSIEWVGHSLGKGVICP